jgi:hypothetical protein
MLSAQAPGAHINTYRFTVFYYLSRVDIGHPAPVGMAFRMTYIMTELRRFAAYFTFHRIAFLPLTWTQDWCTIPAI